MSRRNDKDWREHSSYGEDRRMEDCYDDDGNVIEDCMERLREEEGSAPPKRHSRFRTKFEEDEYNAGEAKWGRAHFDEETARRKGRDRFGGGATPYPKNKRSPTAPAGVAMRKKRVV